ncbi:dihydrodipicolinate reductase [Candidatus Bathyarchaeota archaeon]|jgi:4-hydroxy-tetrahydrodipicolinate reductase|nr:dihydrodipicolinate reductase [Candidatus Bathyarchaeota archaeon]MDP7207157.1 dihydrodipicolinate reductase [Candidatus Bathyarchaeota archaeon]MDP7443510.1 dihydrodipicolinate reductase [Candidatus Bathyarchaeota archaeon]
MGNPNKQGKTELKPVKVVSYGIGVIGRRLARHLLTKKGVEIVGAIDINPEIIGKDLGEVLDVDKLGVTISNDTDKVLSTIKPDIVCHTTLSYLKQTHDQFVQILNHGVNIVSTCEELAYPYATKEGGAYAKKLDKVAKENGVTLLGTGINPGFLMDTLPIFLTGVCTRVDDISIKRQMDAATRRVPFQKKIGAGLSVNVFRDKIATREITGHVGLEQSIQMIADAVGWELDEIKVNQVQPVVLDYDAASDAIDVPKGHNAGSMQMAYGMRGGKPLITMDFKAYIGAPDEFDSVSIRGEPPINERTSPCIHGDFGTIAITSNVIPHVINSDPGFKTMVDMPPPHATTAHMRKYLK